ncbi:MAG: extracellular solute-binding protein, partial [Clostridia bacterium]|nr:extracellular solute-binding protein [Clostridia bacterium]
AIAGGWQTLSTVVYYNKDLFEENGIKTPREWWKEGKWNWDTFKQSALAISGLGDYYFGYAGRDSYAYMLAAGCDYVKFDGKKFVNSSTEPALKKAWEFSNEMMASGAQFRPDGKSNYPQLFLEGKFGMYGEGSYCMANIGMLGDYAFDPAKVDFEIDAVPFPNPAGQAATVIHRGNLFGVAKNAKNPVAAGVFLRFWLDPKNAPSFSKTALNNNMRDAFEWINSENNVKKAFLSGGVLGYQDTEKMGNLTYRLLTQEPSQIDSNIATFKSFIDSSVAAANKALG